MGQLRLGARLFILLLVATAVTLLVRQLSGGTISERENAELALALAIPAYALADIFGVRLHRKGITTTLSTTISFAALLHFGPVFAGITAFCGTCLSEMWARRVWYKLLFNASSFTLELNLAWLVYGLLNDGTTHLLTSPSNVLAITAAGLTFQAANTLVICTVVALAEGDGILSVWRASFKGFSVQFLTLVPVGALFALVYEQAPLGVLLLLFPILLTHYSFKAYEKLRSDSQRAMETLATAVDRRDPYTYHHSERVAEFSEQIAQQMRLDIVDTETIVGAARVHDLGKIGIDSSVLLKPGKLDEREWAIMKEHPRIGAEIVSQMSTYERVRDLVAYHQERYDGKGYPCGLVGEAIPLGARIIAVADAFDAMTSDRPYRKALGNAIAIAELRKGRGTQFDPGVVDAFVAALEGQTAARPVAVPVERPTVTLEPVSDRRGAS